MQLTNEQISNLSSRELMNKLDEIRQLAIKSGSDWAFLQGKYKRLKEMMPSFLAEFQRIYFKPGSTISEARMMALSDPNYKDKLEEMVNAEREANMEEVRYRSSIESIKAISAISYLRNQEAKLSR